MMQCAFILISAIVTVLKELYYYIIDYIKLCGHGQVVYGFSALALFLN